MLHLARQTLLFRPAATILLVDTATDAVGATTYSFANRATGKATPGRRTILGVVGHDSATDFSITGVTMDNGVGIAPMRSVITTAVEIGSLEQAGLFILPNPAGSTATFAITWSEAISNCAIAVWSADYLLSDVAFSAVEKFDTAAGVMDVSMSSVRQGGIAVGISETGNASQLATWTGLIKNGSEFGGGTISVSTAHLAISPGKEPFSITADWDGANDAVAVAAAWR